MKTREERKEDFERFLQRQRNAAGRAHAEREQPGIIYNGLTGKMSVRVGNEFMPVNFGESPEKIAARQKYLAEKSRGR